MSWLEASWGVFLKDVRVESRSRSALGAIVLFAVVTLTAVSYAVGAHALTPEIQAALLWVVLFFASMAGLVRSFGAEAERGTLMALRLSAPGHAVYIGKFLFNVLTLLILGAVVMILFQILLPLTPSRWGLLLLGLGLGAVALAAVTTLVSAIVAEVGLKGTLFTLLAFPILVPVLVAGIGITRKSLAPEVISPWPEIQLLVAYAGLMVTVSILLMDYVWRD